MNQSPSPRDSSLSISHVYLPPSLFLPIYLTRVIVAFHLHPYNTYSACISDSRLAQLISYLASSMTHSKSNSNRAVPCFKAPVEFNKSQGTMHAHGQSNVGPAQVVLHLPLWSHPSLSPCASVSQVSLDYLKL